MYWFSNANQEVLYVGKAKNLKNRLQSYQRFKQLTPRIQTMVSEATQVSWQVLSSELLALLTEAELIRTHQPPYNILLKDDKSPLYILITDDEYPRVLTIRKKEIMTTKPSGMILGPFPSGYKVKEVLKLVRPIFPWCNKAGRPTHQFKKACFYYHLDLCPGACLKKIDPSEYQDRIKHLVLFLRGKNKDLLKHLATEMKTAAEQEDYEQAAEIRDTVQLIESVIDYRRKLRPNLQLPQIQATESQEQLTRLRGILADHLPVPRDYYLHRIEGYDVSNTQGTNPTVAQVTFTDGQPTKQHYRLYNIKSLSTPNDYAMMKEALVRRQTHPEWPIPSLVVIDGGKGQLKAGLSVWHWSCPVISIAKNPDRIIIPQLQANTPDEITARTKLQYAVLKLDPNHPALKLVQKVRDEAHRFSKQQHTRLRNRNLFQ